MIMKKKNNHLLADFCSVAAVIYYKGAYLMQLRDDIDTIESPNHWALFGGRIEHGETPRESIQRELFEELNFCPPVISFLGEMSYRKMKTS